MAATAAMDTVIMSSSNTDSVLRTIASSRIKDEIDSAYSGIGDAMKEIGGPSNNMLLKVVHMETKRTADEISKLNIRMAKIESALSSMSIGISTLCELMAAQNEMIASGSFMPSTDGTSSRLRNPSAESNWFYQGTKLTSRYHMYACIILHLVDMIQIHMDISNTHYPDSVDCDFKTMQNAVRIVSTVRCNIPSVEYKNTIDAKEKDSQPFNMLYPHIASRDPESPTTLTESTLGHIYNPVTRNTMQDLEWIRQRLCHLDGILSAKQIDVLKSIHSPLIRQGTVDELNWNSKLVIPRMEHPLVREITAMTKNKKDQYILARMQGKKLEPAYNIAKDYIKSK